MTRQENLIYRKQCPYDAMGDYSVLMENEKNIKTERNAKKSDRTTLAEYLSVDRSAMMRELKNLADEGIIERDGKKLRILD